MAKNKKKPLEAVKLDARVVQKVRKNKEKTRVPISAFFEQAALKELSNQ